MTDYAKLSEAAARVQRMLNGESYRAVYGERLEAMERLYRDARKKSTERPSYSFSAWKYDEPQRECESRDEWLKRWNDAEAALIAEFDAATDAAIEATKEHSQPGL